MNREFFRRATFLGVIAWVSLCLLAIGMVPELSNHISHVLAISGLLGLASAVGLLEVAKSERRAHDRSVSNMKRARRDDLTGLSNRWEFDRLINIMVADAHSQEIGLALILVDIDGLKDLNRYEGFGLGDSALQQVAQSTLAATRGADLVARYGDDEFAVVLTGVDRETCETVIRRLRGTISAKVQAGPKPLTVSVGAASLQANEASAEEMRQRAELAMFRAKSDGRNRGCYHDGSRMTKVGAERGPAPSLARA